MPLYNKWFEMFGQKHNAKIDKKVKMLKSRLEMLNFELEPIVSAWEGTKVIKEIGGKSYATYDPKLTKQKLDLTEKIENVERKITHSTHAQKKNFNRLRTRRKSKSSRMQTTARTNF